MRHIASKVKYLAVIAVLFMASLLLGAGPWPLQKVFGADLDNRRLLLSNNLPGQKSSYEISFDYPTTSMVGSIEINFCESSPIFDDPCVAPAGFDLSGAVLTTQTGENGFSISPASTSNTLILTRPPGITIAGTASYLIENVSNASAAGSNYARYQTYASADASGTYTDRGGVAYVLQPALNVSTEVPPFLEFCAGVSIPGQSCSTVSGSYVELGVLSADRSNINQSQLMAATNAQNGYSVFIGGSTLTSGNNTLPPLSAPTFSAPGTSQFGINLRANSNPAGGAEPGGVGTGQPTQSYNQPNRFMFRNGDLIAASGKPDNYRKYSVSYMASIGSTQPPGIYSATYTFVAAGNF